MQAPALDNRSRRLFIWLLILAVFFFLLYEIRSVLLPFVVGILTAYFLDPATDRLQAAGAGRNTATVFITVLFFNILIAVLLLVAPLIARQFADLMSAAPDYLAEIQNRYGTQLQAWLSQVDDEQAKAIKSALSNATENIIRLTGDVLTRLFQSGMALVNVLSLLLITPLVTFYLLRDWDNIKARVDALLPRTHAETIRSQLRAIDATLAGFIRGQLNVCVILAVYYSLSLTVVGLPFGLVIGILSGLLVILPYVGFLFMCVIALGVAYADFGFTNSFFAVVGVYLLAQILESYILTPKLVGNKVGLHPLWIIFGMLTGGALFGFVGVLLSVPVTAIVGVLIRFATARYLESSLYHGR